MESIKIFTDQFKKMVTRKDPDLSYYRLAESRASRQIERRTLSEIGRASCRERV